MRPGPRELLFVGVLLAIPLATWHFVLSPRTKSNDAMLSRIEEKYARLRDLDRARALATGNLQEEIAVLEKAIGIVQARLPSEEQTDKVLRGLSLLANSNRLRTKKIETFQRVSDRLTAAKRPYAEQAISIELEGDFLGFYAFLQALENQPRIIRVDAMKLDKPEAHELEGQIKASLSLRMFFQRATETS